MAWHLGWRIPLERSLSFARNASDPSDVAHNAYWGRLVSGFEVIQLRRLLVRVNLYRKVNIATT
jgi:hypothetical protein